MSSLLPAMLTGAAAALLGADRAARRRLDRLTRRPRIGRRPPPARRHHVAGAVAAVAVALFVGGTAGVVIGAAVLVTVVAVLGRLEPAAQRRDRERVAAELPMALDLLAACLVAGAPVELAITRSAAVFDGPLGRAFGQVAAALAMGVPAAEAWADVHPPTDGLRALGRTLGRAQVTGEPVAGAIDALAAELSGRRCSEQAAAARRAGVLAVAPLGVCFLPAFVLVAVVPVVAGLVGRYAAGLTG
jgi:pilus assembly protein TadC